MKHTMIDCYGSKNHNLENLVYINDTLNKLSYRLGLEPIANPYLIPYYYEFTSRKVIFFHANTKE